jgi:hypothetical protein
MTSPDTDHNSSFADGHGTDNTARRIANDVQETFSLRLFFEYGNESRAVDHDHPRCAQA